MDELKQFTDRAGLIYGTEDWCLWLYALVKMQRPKTILELGTGALVSTLWLGRAAKENGVGHVWTVDDGRDWPLVFERQSGAFPQETITPDFADFFRRIVGKFGFEQQITHLACSMPPFPELEDPIDLLFSDFRHRPEDLVEILAFYLPRLNDAGSVFLDSASTHYPSYALLEAITLQLNAGKIPDLLWQRIEPARREPSLEWVRRRSFQLVHLVESKQRAQNSTAWLRYWPADVRPWPISAFH
jgi:predicted O-methyltransferase YrrM